MSASMDLLTAPKRNSNAFITRTTSSDLSDPKRTGLNPRTTSDLNDPKRRMSRDEKKIAKKEEKLSSRLSDLVFLKATKLKRFSDAESWGSTQMTSLSENRSRKLLSKGDEGFQTLVDYNSQHLSRVYPKATRFDSSNFDPILYWFVGCQLVALNYQTNSPPMWINYAKFEENAHSGFNLRRFNFIPANTFGGAGAVAKGKTNPESLERFSRPMPQFQNLRLEMFGGRFFPVCSALYFVIQLFDGESEAFRFKSDPVANSFAPDINFENLIPVSDTANSYLAISVWSSNNVNIAHWCGGLEMLRQGYRVLEMLDSNNKPIAKKMCHTLIRLQFGSV